MLGVGFSFGGCVLTAIAGTAPQEEHGLCGLVSISGLFDMPAMMKHIAEQYAYPYGFANTKVRGGGIGSVRRTKFSEDMSVDARKCEGDRTLIVNGLVRGNALRLARPVGEIALLASVRRFANASWLWRSGALNLSPDVCERSRICSTRTETVSLAGLVLFRLT